MSREPTNNSREGLWSNEKLQNSNHFLLGRDSVGIVRRVRNKCPQPLGAYLPVCLTLTFLSPPTPFHVSLLSTERYCSLFLQNILKRHESCLLIGNLCFHPCNPNVLAENNKQDKMMATFLVKGKKNVHKLKSQ